MAEVKIIISAQVDQATGAITKLEASTVSSFNKIENKTKTIAEKFKANWLAASAAIVGAMYTIHKAFDFMELGAKALQSEESFRSVTAAYGIHADEMLSKMKQVSLGMVDESALMQRAVRGLQQGLQENQIVQLLEISRGAARTASTDIVTAFDAITTAAANQMTRGLKSMGIVIDQRKALEDYAKSLHTTVEALNEQEQSQAIANAAIAEGQRQLQAYGEMTLNPAERIQKLRAQIEELKESIGKGLIRVAFGAVGAFQWLAAGALVAFSALAKVNQGLSWITDILGFTEGEYKKWGEAANTAFSAAEELTGKAAENFKAMTASSEDMGKAMGKAAADGVRPLSEEIIKLNKQIQDLIDKATMTPIELIQKQASEWEKAGADRILIERWVQAGIKKIQEEGYREEIKKTYEAWKDYAIEVFEYEKKAIKDRIDAALDYRNTLIGAYDAALAKANEYYSSVAAMEGIIKHGKEFLESYKAKPLSITEQMEKDEKALKALLKEEGFNIFDYEQTTKTMEAVEGFLTKYKGQKDILGFDIDFGGLINEYEKLNNKVDMMRQNAVETTNAWIDFADKQIAAIKSVDEWINYLQKRVDELDAQLSYVRDIKVDTSAAVTNVQILLDKIYELNNLVASSSEVNVGSATSQTPQYYTGPGGVVMPPTGYLGEYQFGTPYVPKTGPYLLHEGERVIPAGKTENITFAPSLYIGDTGGKSGSTVAREADKEWADMIRRGTSKAIKEIRKKMGNN